jgi:sirohydrochlorin cobaltochelatase
MSADQLGVVLIGHGSPALDCPPQLIGELMSLEWRGSGSGHHHGVAPEASARPPGPPSTQAGAGGEEDIRRRTGELDAAIRDWPRRADNDPYKCGVEQLADALRPLLPTDCFAIGYNEFCRPSIAEAIEQVIGAGASRVLVIPTMLTPGGVHSEVDIPRALEVVRHAHPAVAIEYVWPFDLKAVAALLASHLARAAQAPSATG